VLNDYLAKQARPHNISKANYLIARGKRTYYLIDEAVQ